MRHFWTYQGDRARKEVHDLFWALWRWSTLGFVQPTARPPRSTGRSPLARLTRSIASRCDRVVRGTPLSPARLGLWMGTAPLAQSWFERGPLVHRYYLERYLATVASDIRGRCLEFQEDSYTSRFGGARVSRLDILHKEPDPRHPQATMYADLTAPNDLPGEAFDCIVCTYVLHGIFELDRFVAELYRLLADDGVLLVAVPGITVTYPQYEEYWRFTPEGLQRVLARAFGADQVQARSYGNSLTAAGELRGLRVPDFSPAELEAQDDRYPLVVCARAVKVGQRHG